jgi:hypothetical protein
MNKVTKAQDEVLTEVKIKDLPAGTIVTWEDNYYVVTSKAAREKGFGAINLSSGTYITVEATVKVVNYSICITPGNH